MDKNMCVVISAGGKGSRLRDLTKGTIPKSLVECKGTPLITYQIKQFLKCGFRDFFISFNEEKHISLVNFSDFDANFVYSTHTYGHPLNTFLDNRVKEFVKERDFVWSWGDVYFDQHLIVGLVRIFLNNSTSVCSGTSPTCGFEFNPAKKYLSYELRSDSLITKFKLEHYVGQEQFGLHIPALFSNGDLHYLTGHENYSELSLRSVFAKMIKDQRLSVFMPDIHINVNTPNDFEKLFQLSNLS